MATVGSITEAIYRSRFEDQMTAGAASAAKAMKDLGSSVIVTDEAVSRSTRSAQSWLRSADPMTAAATRLTTAQRNLAQAQKTLATEQAAGGEKAAAAQRALDGLSQKVAKAKADLAALEKGNASASAAISGVGNSARLTTRELQALSPQIADVGVSLLGGMSPLLVLVQQGPQITDAVGGIGRAFSLLRTAAIAAAPAILAIGIPAAMIASYNSLEGRMAALRASLRGVTEDYRRAAVEVEAASTRISQAGIGVSREEANASQLAFRRNAPAGATFDFEALAREAADFAKVIGGDVTSASERLARAMRDPAALVEQLAEQNFPGMNSALLLTVERLVQGGERGDAFRLVMDRIKDTTAGAARDGLSPFARATRDLGSAWDSVWDGITKGLAGPGEALARWLTRLLRDSQGLQRPLSIEALTYGTDPDLPPVVSRPDTGIADLDRRIAEASAALAAATAAATRGGVLASATAQLRSAEIDRLQSELDALQASRQRYASVPGRPAEGSGYREPDWAAGLPPANGRINSLSVEAGTVVLPEVRIDGDGGARAAQQVSDLLDRAYKIAIGTDGRLSPTQSVDTQRGVIAANIVTLQRAAASGQATPQQMEVFTRGIEAQRQAYESTTTAAERLTRSERERTAILGILDPVQREVAEAVQQYREAQRAAGREASPAEEAQVAAARLGALQVAYRGVTEQARLQTEASTRVAAAYGRTAQAGREQEMRERALIEVRRSGIQGAERQAAAVALLTEEYQRSARAEAEKALAQRNRQGEDDLAYMQREAELIGATTEARERELAVFRLRQQAARDGVPVDSQALRDAEDLAARSASLRSTNEQLRNSWSELTSFADRTFDKIGSAITEAFAQGKISAINFGNIAKAVMSEVVQAAMRLAVINPILNQLFGGSRGTLGGIGAVAGMGGLGLGGNSASAGTPITDASGNITGYIGQAGNMSSMQTITGGLRGFNPGAMMSGAYNWSTGFSGVDSVLNTPLWGATGAEATNAALGQMGAGVYGPATPGAVSGAAGQTVGSLGAGALGVAGGLYGAYSGFQRGGVGGYTQAAGGVATAGLSAAAMAGLAIPVYGWIAAAVLSVIGALLPGQKPSGKGQETAIDLVNASETYRGLGGDRYSAGNREQSQTAAQAIASMSAEIGSKLGGIGLYTDAAVGVTQGRGGDDKGQLYLRVGDRRNQFENTEEGAKALADQVGKFLFDEYKAQDRATGDYAGILRGSGSLEDLEANLQWYTEVYKQFGETAQAANAFQQALDQVNASFQPTIDKANQLSLATDRITEARDKELARIRAQRDAELAAYDLSMQIAYAQATGGGSAAEQERLALMQFDAQGKQGLEQAKAQLESWGLSAEDVTSRIVFAEQVLAAQRLAVQKQYADAALAAQEEAAQRLQDAFRTSQSSYVSALDAEIAARQQSISATQQTVEALRAMAAGLRDFIGSLQIDANLSPLTMQQRLAESRKQYDELLAQSQTGTPEERMRAAQQLQSAATARLNIASSYYAPGTAAYVSEFESVTGGMGGLAGQFSRMATVEEMSLKAEQSALDVLIEQRDQAAEIGKATVEGLDALRSTFLQAALVAGHLKVDDPSIVADGIPGLSGTARHLVEGALKGANANYLADNPDVAAAVKSGMFSSEAEHYRLFGKDEGREYGLNATYLANNPDVAAAVQSGMFSSGLEHYMQFGASEGRKFARGGYASPGWAMVGEEGPELVNFTMPGRVYTAAETRDAMRGGDSGAIVAEIKALRAEVARLTTVSAQGSMAVKGEVAAQTEVLVDATASRMPVPA